MGKMKNKNKLLSLTAALALAVQTGVVLPVSAENEAAKIGLIYSQEAETNTDWNVNEYFSAENTDTGVKYTAIDNAWGTTPQRIGKVIIQLGDEKIKFDSDKTVVIETALKIDKGDGAARVGLYYNTESKIKDEDNTGTNQGPKDAIHGSNHLFIGGLYNDTGKTEIEVIYPQGVAGNGFEQTSIQWPAEKTGYTLDGTMEYKMVVKLDVPGNSLKYSVYSGETLVDEHTSSDLGWVTVSEYLNSVAIANMSDPAQSVEVNYVKVYNVPDSVADDYTKFTEAQEETVISDVKVDGVAVEDVFEAETGKVTFTSNKKITTATVSYVKDGETVTLTQGTDYTVENGAVTFTAELATKATYTVSLDLGYATYPITFDSVYDQPIGLIYSNDGEDGWAKGYDFSTNTTQKADFEYKTDDNVTYMHFTPSGSANIASYLSTPMIYTSLGGDKIKFKKDYTIVMEMKVRTNATNDAYGRARINYSFPENTSLKNFTYINDQSIAVTDQKETKYQANLCSETLFEFLQGGVRFGLGTYPEKTTNGVTAGQWYKITAMIDGDYKAKYVVTNADTNAQFATHSGQMQIKPESGFFENVALTTWMQSGTLAEGAYTDVDYVKVYNMPSALADNYADFAAAIDEWKISNVEKNFAQNSVSFDGAPEGAEFSVTAKNVQTEETKQVTDFTVAYNDGTTTLTFTELENNMVYTVSVAAAYTNSFDFETEYVGKTGLIKKADSAADFENLWSDYASVSAVEDSDGTTWTRVKIDTVSDGGEKLASVKMSLGDERIKLEEDKIVRVKTRIRGKIQDDMGDDDYARFNMYANIPTDTATWTDGERTQTRNFNFGWNHAALWSLQGKNQNRSLWGYVNGMYDNSAKPNGDGVPTQTKMSWDTAEALAYDGTEAIVVTMDLDKTNNSAKFVFETENSACMCESENLGFNALNDWLESIAIGCFKKGDYFDVDYIEVYNLDKSAQEIKVEEKDGKVVLTTGISDAELSAEGATLYAASYDSEGALTGVQSVKAKNGAEITVTGEVRTFLWNKAMQPIDFK